MAAELLVSVGLTNLALTAVVPWGVYLAIFLDGYTANMLFKCANDPPPMPDFSTFNPMDLIGGILSPAFKPAQQKLQAAFENWFWHQFCFCSTGSLTQLAPVPAPPPNGTTLFNRSGTVPCAIGGWTGVAPSFVIAPPGIGSGPDLTTQIVPVGAGRFLVTTAGPPFTIYEIPSGITSVRGTGSVPVVGTISMNQISQMNVYAFDQFHAFMSSMQFTSPGPGLDFDLTFNVDPAWRFWIATASNAINSGDPPISGQSRLSTQVFCGGGSPLTLESCCPPDPQIASMLQSILTSIGQIPTGGGLPVGSYVDSTVHSGLQLLGTIPINKNTLAIRAVIVQDNNQLPVGIGDPPYLFDRGFIVPTVSNGAVRGNVRLTYNPQLYVLPQFTEQIGYTLANGLIVNLTELVAGP